MALQNTDWDWVDGWQAGRLLELRAHHRQKADQAGEVLSEMEVVVPWQALIDVIQPFTPKRARKTAGLPTLATMLRGHLLQQWYSLSD